MQHLKSIDDLQLESCELTIGSFDGIHIGHQAIIQQMKFVAAKSHAPVVVLTFHPHPSIVLRGNRPAFYINTPDEKATQLGALGVDFVITQRFDINLSKIKAADFLDWISRQLNFRGLWAGENFALGHQREGNRSYLEKASHTRGFELHIVEPMLEGGEIVSSTRVREALHSGDVSRVARYLGRYFAIPGKVVKGAGRGKELGIPTANLKIWNKRAYPGIGVYACMAKVGGKDYRAVTNIGVRPTFDEDRSEPIIEAHLLDFEGDMYGEEITLSFIERLRDERRFSGVDELLREIERDIHRAKSILSNYKA